MANPIPSSKAAGRERGIAYIAVLLLIALSSGTLGAVGMAWHAAQQREKERELLFIGAQYRNAIMQYYEKSPGGAKRYPASFEVLLKDDRYPSTQRYLRTIFTDPMTGKPDWGIVQAPGGGIMGVHSRSDLKPYKTANFPLKLALLEKKNKYSEWTFVYLPESGTALPVAAGIKPATR